MNRSVPACLNGLLLAAAVTTAVSVGKMAWLGVSSRHELYASWQLLSTVLLNKLLLRGTLLLGGILFATFGPTAWARLAGLLLILCGEFLGRYLFFVSVVPTNIASGYLAREAA